MKRVKLLLSLLFLTQIAFGQWEKLEIENSIGRVYGIYSTSDSIYVASARGVFSSGDGNTWNFIGGGSYNGYYSSADIMANDTALIESSVYGVFYSKYDRIWKKVAGGSGLPEDKYLDIVSNGNKIFVRSSGGYIYSYSIGSELWVKENLLNHWPATTLSSNGNDVIVGYSNYYGAYSQNNENATWTFMNVFKDDVVNKFFQKGDTILANFKKAGDSIAVSNDNGKSWVKNILPFPSYVSSFELNNNTLFYSFFNLNLTMPSDFYLSLDNGLNWTSANMGLIGRNITDIKIFKGNIYTNSADGEGIYRRKLSQLSGIIYNGGGNLEAIKVKNATYQWFFNDLPIEAATARTYQAGENGKYKVEITVQNPAIRTSGSPVFSYEFEVSDLTVTNVINSKNNSGILSAFYDAFSQSVYIDVEEGKKAFDVEVYNLMGQNLMKGNNESQNISLDFSRLETGTYIVRVNLGSQYHSLKVFKY